MRSRDGLPPGSGNEAYDFLRLHPTTQPRHRAGQVTVYAAEDGALKQIDPEGVESALGAGGGASPVDLLLAQHSLTVAQIKALAVSGFELVAPPDGGQAIIPVEIVTSYAHGAVGYNFSTPNLSVYYGSQQVISSWDSGIDSAVVSQFRKAAAGTIANVPGTFDAVAPTLYSDAASDATTGDGALAVAFVYYLMAL